MQQGRSLVGMVEVPGWNEEIHDAIKALVQLVDGNHSPGRVTCTS
jgi:hypothetical protein